jgi:HK97 family phage portal protein
VEFFGFELTITRKAAGPRPVAALSPLSDSRGWYPIVVREPFTGAWQLNAELSPDSLLRNPTVFACVTRIAQDCGKLRLRLVEEQSPGVWAETTNPAYSPVLRKPNDYQTTPKFVEQWMTSKLIWGNTYVLKRRDARGVVVALYVLDPSRVTVLVAPDGSVYYQLRRNDLAGVAAIEESIAVPARDIIHDRMVCLFHPLVGVPPLYAAALAAEQALTIQQTSTQFFGGGSHPGGVLTAPGAITEATGKRLQDYWDSKFTGNSVGKVAVLGDGLKYEQLAVNASDAQLIEQLNATDEDICTAFGMPMFLLNATQGAPYANNELILQLYYAECLQSPIHNFETSLDEGLGFAPGLGTELDIDDLIWMDTATRTKAAADAIGAGAMSPNEARRKYFGLGPVDGGDTPYLQQQMFSLAALAERDAAEPFAKSAPATPAAEVNTSPELTDDQIKAFARSAFLDRWESAA